MQDVFEAHYDRTVYECGQSRYIVTGWVDLPHVRPVKSLSLSIEYPTVTAFVTPDFD